MREGKLYAGHAERILHDDRLGQLAPSGILEELGPPFERFAAEARARELGDARTRAGLRALGYAGEEAPDTTGEK